MGIIEIISVLVSALWIVLTGILIGSYMSCGKVLWGDTSDWVFLVIVFTFGPYLVIQGLNTATAFMWIAMGIYEAVGLSTYLFSKR